MLLVKLYQDRLINECGVSLKILSKVRPAVQKHFIDVAKNGTSEPLVVLQHIFYNTFFIKDFIIYYIAGLVMYHIHLIVCSNIQIPKNDQVKLKL